MKTTIQHTRAICLLLVLAMCMVMLSACASRQADQGQATDREPDTSGFLVAVEDEPDTVDFQCTSIHYTVAQNVFNRLVEMESDANGDMEILPSLAESWEISDDGRIYTFHLRDGLIEMPEAIPSPIPEQEPVQEEKIETADPSIETEDPSTQL